MSQSEKILKEIREGAYWRVLQRPRRFVRERLPLTKCREIVERSTVALRGWDYPHMNFEEVEWLDDSLSCNTSFHYFREFWRFFQSGQFVFLRRFKEDFFEAEARGKAAMQGIFVPEGIVPSGFSSIVEMIYCVTEFLDFSAQVARRIAPEESIYLEVSMNAVNHRVLYLDHESGRTFNRVLVATAPTLTWKQDLSPSELTVNHDAIAIEAVGHLLKRFAWSDWRKSEEFLREEQSRLRSLYRK